jgi:hypothetical protein
MALEVDYQYSTYSRNVVIEDTALESYKGIDVRSCGGVTFDVYLMNEGGSGPQMDLGVEGFRGVIEVLKHDSYPEVDDYLLGVEVIEASKVTFSHVADPEHFDATLDEDWNNLALDSVEWLLRGKQCKVDSSLVLRRSRYQREPVI